MSTRIIHDPQEQVAALYDSATGAAFGDVFEGEEAYEEAERFVAWVAVRAPHLNLVTASPWAARHFRRVFADAEAEARKPDGVPLREEG